VKGNERVMEKFRYLFDFYVLIKVNTGEGCTKYYLSVLLQ